MPRLPCQKGKRHLGDNGRRCAQKWRITAFFLVAVVVSVVLVSLPSNLVPSVVVVGKKEEVRTSNSSSRDDWPSPGEGSTQRSSGERTGLEGGLITPERCQYLPASFVDTILWGAGEGDQREILCSPYLFDLFV